MAFVLLLLGLFILANPTLYADKAKKLESHQPILKEIILVDAPEKILTGKYYGDESVVIENFDVPNEEKLKNRLEAYIGEPITISLLDEIRDRIVNFYHDEGYPLVGVSAPAGQDISGGKVYIMILIGKLKEVKARGAKYFSNEKIAEEISLKPGDEITLKPLLDDISWLNQNPFRSVQLVYEKGPSLGQTDIVLVTEDRKPWRLYAGYLNTGNIIAGNSRWFTGLNLGNLWNADHQLNLQFASGTPLNDWWGVDGNYIAPLPWRHIWKVMGSYTKAKPENLSDLQGFSPNKQSGFQAQAATRYEILLPTLNSYQHSCEIGYEYKRENNALTVSPALIFNTTLEISQFTLGYNFTWEGLNGTTFFDFVAFLSPGNMTSKNSNKYFEAQRPGAHANYAYFRWSLDRTQMLPKKFSWVLSSLFQWTGSKLEPSEELSLGGYATIRGYDENEIVSDRGMIIKNEFRSPPISFKKKKDDALQFLIFGDFGIANNVDEQIYNRDNVALASVGPGVRYNIPGYLTFFFDWGIQLHYIKNRPFVDNQRGRIHTGITLGY